MKYVPPFSFIVMLLSVIGLGVQFYALHIGNEPLYAWTLMVLSILWMIFCAVTWHTES